MKCQGRTMRKVHGNVVTSNIRRHGHDGSHVKLSNQMACRNAIEVRHDNVHEHQIILRSSIHLIDSF